MIGWNEVRRLQVRRCLTLSVVQAASQLSPWSSGPDLTVRHLQGSKISINLDHHLSLGCFYRSSSSKNTKSDSRRLMAMKAAPSTMSRVASAAVAALVRPVKARAGGASPNEAVNETTVTSATAAVAGSLELCRIVSPDGKVA